MIQTNLTVTDDNVTAGISKVLKYKRRPPIDHDVMLQAHPVKGNDLIPTNKILSAKKELSKSMHFRKDLDN